MPKQKREVSRQRRCFHMPQLKWQLRFLLYLGTILAIGGTILLLVCGYERQLLSGVVYAVAAILLCVAVYYLIKDIQYVRHEVIMPLIEAHHFMRRVTSDYHYRTVVFTQLSLLVNLSFAVFNGIYGWIAQSWWFLTFAVYYILLSLMRFCAIRTERRNAALCEKMSVDAEVHNLLQNDSKSLQHGSERQQLNEWRVFRLGGILFLPLTITLAGTVILILRAHEGRFYPGTLIFVVALYTFYKITVSIINMVRVRKLRLPVVTMIRNIGYADSLASLVLLQTAMFASFGADSGEMEWEMNLLTGIGACVMVLLIGIGMIVEAQRELRAGKSRVS